MSLSQRLAHALYLCRVDDVDPQPLIDWWKRQFGIDLSEFGL